MKENCKTENCKKKVRAKGYCSKHYTEHWRKNNLELSTYLNLKHNAKRRNKNFDIDFEQFVEFAARFKYFAKKGRSKESLHIDRIDECGGYTIDNIQAISNTANVKKWLDYYYDDYSRSMNFKFKKNGQHSKKSGCDNDVPF